MKQQTFAGVLCAVTLGFTAQVSHAAPVSGQGTWETTLQGRDLDGNAATFEAYYDTTLDITWLADANAAGTTMTWAAANAWAAGLTLGGFTDWRLPTNTPINGSSYQTNFTNNATSDLGYADSAGWVDGSGNPVSEMGHMYYVTLGNLGFCTPDNLDPTGCTAQPGWGPSNTGPFSNLQSDFYWSGSALDSSSAWDFDFFFGIQGNDVVKSSNGFAWAVRSGDVSAVPVPAAVWLFGSGLMGLLGLARRKR